MILISDIHGCYLTLLQLIAKCPDEQIVFCGDLVDRGPRSREVIQFAIDQKIPTVIGNHDHMMADYLLKKGELLKHGNPDCWAVNGAMSTIESYNNNDSCMMAHAEWLADLPFFIEYDDLLVTHNGNGRDGLNWFEQIWTRNILKAKCHRFRVFGHTPGSDVVIDDREKYANIDTGCAYKKFGNLTAFRWPQREIITQTCID